MAGLTNSLYDALNEKMKSTTMSSALTFYNDKEMTKQMTQYKKDIKSWETKLQTMEDHYYKSVFSDGKSIGKLEFTAVILVKLSWQQLIHGGR